MPLAGMQPLHPLRPPRFLHPPNPAAPPCTLPGPPPCPLSQGERSSALLLLVAAAAAAGVYQLGCAARHALAPGRSRRERMRPAVACLVRALLLLAASVPVQRCEGDGGYGGGCADKDFEYDGFEDARAVSHRGTIYLVATHEDCSGGRRVCLLKLGASRGGDSGDGGEGGDGEGGDGDDAVRLRQAGVWPLRIEGGGLTLADIEKNWTPFVHAGALHLSYSLQPHVVLRCGWSGGRCEVVHNTSNAFLETYATLGQGIRGGTPYASLADGSMLAAAHVKDGSHSPALYGTVLYIVDGSPPFRVRSISPKLCISEREIELAISPRCALQYAVGLGIDETHNLALISLGEMDRVMKVAALPLDRLVALARTHTLHDDGVTDSECVTWSTPLSEP